MSQHMDSREGNHEEPSAYSTGYQETPGYNSYATGFGLFGAGQKLSGSAPMSQKPTPGQRLALAIVSLVLWMISLFIMVVAATASQAPSYVAVLILLVLLLFAILIAVINIVFNRGT